MSILFLIPARGGSKRLPGKNLKLLAGIPLVAHAIRRAQGAARLLGGEHRVVVSTDSEEIAVVSREWGAEVLERPEELATDRALSEDVVLHALRQYPTSEMVVLLQPTSPLATPADVIGAVNRCRSGGICSSTVGPSGLPNGAVYAAIRGVIPACWNVPHAPVSMPAARSVDVDTQDDWDMAEALLAARKPAPFSIASREIGPGHPCFVIAEAGVNHNGVPDIALDLVDAAADAGVDAVKFQRFNPEKLAEPGPHRDMLTRLMLWRWEDWIMLKNHASQRGLIFLSSAFDEESVDFLDDLGVPAFKVPSGEIINLPLLRHIASKGKPVILSTGMSTMVEVARAVDALHGVPLALLHCVSEYPARNTVNLAAMDTLRQAFGVPVGWSDHTEFGAVAIVAAARGASIIEKHLMLDGYVGPDTRVSLPPDEMLALVRGIHHVVEESIGSGEKVPTPGELETAKTARRKDGLRRNA